MVPVGIAAKKKGHVAKQCTEASSEEEVKTRGESGLRMSWRCEDFEAVMGRHGSSVAVMGVMGDSWKLQKT
jgi:hypothetical protein